MEIAITGSVGLICITCLLYRFFPSANKQDEIAMAGEAETLEHKVGQLEEQIEFYKAQVKRAVDIKNAAEERQMEAYKAWANIMNGNAELAGYKDGVLDAQPKGAPK